MPPPDPEPAPAAADPCGFATTRWSLIVAAREGASPEARQALSQLCEAYWYPLYAYIRRRGRTADEAQDLTQAFFARLLERDFFGAADPAKGRFRAFLLTSCKNFLANEHDRACAAKRGGRAPVSLSVKGAEERYRREPSHDLTPDQAFERRWALTLLDRVLARVREEFAARGKGELFDRLRLYLVGDRGAPPPQQAAAELGLSVGAFKVAVHRMRQRYGELLREEIAQTVGGPDEVEDEVRALFAALGP
jgi:RNA polymerase sigma-70 factor (ECF subfamily)